MAAGGHATAGKKVNVEKEQKHREYPASPWYPLRCPKDCIYRSTGSMEGCNYLFITGQVRGCEPDENCIRYTGNRKKTIRREIHLKGSRAEETGKPRKGPEPKWDVARGRKLWQQGWSCYRIAGELKVSKTTVHNRRTEHWEKGED